MIAATIEAFRSRGRGHARAASNGLQTPDMLRAPTKHRRHYSMPQPRRRRHGLQPDRRRALELLCRDGCAEALMIARGLTITQMVEPVRAGHSEQYESKDVRCDHSNQ